MYCAVDPLFYDALSNTKAPTAEFAADRAVPEGWARELSDDWVVLGPAGGALPAQGWKVHVSACLDNAARVLDGVWEYCVARGIAFKFLRGPQMLLMRNAKYARRGSSGKFITVYPRDEAELELVCKAQRLGLARALAAERVLVLDDVTSNVDTVTEHRMSRALLGRADPRTRIIATHRSATAARADAVLWLDHGRQRRLGRHAELWRDPAYRRVFGHA